MQTKKYNRNKSVKFKCFASLVIVLIKQINKQKYLLLPLRQKTEGRFYIIKVGRKQKRMQSKKIKQKKTNSLTTLESHHFRITSFQFSVINRENEEKKIKKIIEFHNEKQAKKKLLSKNYKQEKY